GSPGNDALDGGDGDDTLIITSGTDTATGGNGFDVLRYAGDANANTLNLAQAGNLLTVSGLLGGTVDVSGGGIERVDVVGGAGDGSDLVEGGEGADVLVVNGSAGADAFGLSPNGTRLRLDVAPGVQQDVAGVEQVDVNGLAGADTFTVNDLSTTEVRLVNLD